MDSSIKNSVAIVLSIIVVCVIFTALNPSEKNITGNVPLLYALTGCSLYSDWADNKNQIIVSCGSGEVLAGYGKCEYGTPSENKLKSDGTWSFKCSKKSKGKKIYGWVVCCIGNPINLATTTSVLSSSVTELPDCNTACTNPDGCTCRDDCILKNVALGRSCDSTECVLSKYTISKENAQKFKFGCTSTGTYGVIILEH